MSNFLDEATDELKHLSQGKVLEWLLGPDIFHTKVETLTAQDGETVLVVRGQSQDSRRAPFLDALNQLKSLPKSPQAVMLYGLGSPALVKALLKKTKQIYALEPSPGVARAFFGALKLGNEIKNKSFQLLCPFQLSDKLPIADSNIPLISHKPSLRRNPWIFEALKARLLEAPRAMPKDFADLSLLIVPPLSGGSLSLGGFLHKAAEGLKLRSRLIEWPESLIELERSLKRGPSPENQSSSLEPKGLERLFLQALEQIAKEITEFSPDLFLAIAQAPLDPPNLVSLRDRFPKLPFAFWFVEDLKIFTYARNLSPLYDCFFHIQGPFIEKELQNLGVRKAHYLPPAADPDFFRPQTTPEGFRSQLSFMGAGYPNRRVIFSKLIEDYWKKSQKKTQDFKIYGSGWSLEDPLIGPHLFQGGRRVSTLETASIYSGSLISLNIHSGPGPSYNPDSYFVNPRTFEIAASGGFQIIDQRPLLPGLFESGEMAVSQEPESLPEQIEHYLKNPDEAYAMGQRARERVISSHTFTHRLKSVLKLMFT
ncbi:MAG: glycosyltransferase [Deltaproteobacteria bacterium]|jgi:spore maturation protein CgeB|nr:glycosyltransferase [Deltaproteobacteria bacterium]